MNVPIDKNLDAVIRHIVKTDLGDLLSHEIEIRFKDILKQMNTLQTSIDAMTTQLQEDRQDLNQIKIDMAKGLTQNKVIIENQNTAEDKVVLAVKEEASKIPENTKEAVDKIFQKQSFMRKWVDKLIK